MTSDLFHDMTSDFFHDGRPMTEAEYLALGETFDRIELLDGGLHLTPNPSIRHQRACTQIVGALYPAARERGWEALRAVNVRLRPDRITISDIVVTSSIEFDDFVVDASAVVLVGEVLAPETAVLDRVLKMHYYAAARIPWCLLADPDTGSLHLHELTGPAYTEHSVTGIGEELEPIVAVIDPAVSRPPI